MRQLGIDDGMDGIQGIAGDRSLDLLLRIVEDGERRDLRAGAGGGGYGDQRQSRGAEQGAAGMDVANARKTAGRQDGRRLGESIALPPPTATTRSCRP